MLILAVGLWTARSGGHPSSGHTIPGCKNGTKPRAGQSESVLRIIRHKLEQNSGNDASTLALKPTGTVNQSPKQRVPVAPQNGDSPPQIFF